MSNKITRYSLFKDVFPIWQAAQIATHGKSYKVEIKSYADRANRFLGDKSLGDITINDINSLFDYVNELNLSSSTCILYLRFTNHFFNYLVDMGIIEKNPCLLFNSYHYKRSHRREVHVLSSEEIIKIINMTKDTDYGNLMMIVLYTGLKAKNLLMLTWNNVNFENHTIKVNKQIVEVDDKVIEYLLAELKRQYDNKHKSDNWRNLLNFVFTDEKGTIIRSLEFENLLRHIGNLINIPGLNSDYLIDHYIITALRSGVSPKTICDQLGYVTFDYLKEYIKLADITDYGIEIGSSVSLTDTLYERYIKGNV